MDFVLRFLIGCGRFAVLLIATCRSHLQLWLRITFPIHSLFSKPSLVECHETAALLDELIRTDGAGQWPPRADHDHLKSWPTALHPYKTIYLELAPLLPSENASQDDAHNKKLIHAFRSRFDSLLHERVDLGGVLRVLQAAEAGRWDLFPRDAYNAFYCCIASSRHMYRWATVPVVKIAQLEKVLKLPPELDEPWVFLQRRFGANSQAGNVMANMVLNFHHDGSGPIFRINTGMSSDKTSAEYAFLRIFYDVEKDGLGIYESIVHAVISFEHGNSAACWMHIQAIEAQVTKTITNYYDLMHEERIRKSAWMRYVQGFLAWGLEHPDPHTNALEKHDGLSGNQAMVFPVVDAFLGLPPYLDATSRMRNFPRLQREFIKAVERSCFRHRLDELHDDKTVAGIQASFANIVKRMKVGRLSYTNLTFRRHWLTSNP